MQYNYVMLTNRIHLVERSYFIIYAGIVERSYFIIYAGIVERSYLIIYAGISGDVIDDMTSLAASLWTLYGGGGLPTTMLHNRRLCKTIVYTTLYKTMQTIQHYTTLYNT